MPDLTVINSDSYLIDYPTASCEIPDRVAAIINELEPEFDVVEAPSATERDIRLVHSNYILNSVKSDPGLYEAATRAAGGVIRASELAMEGNPAFANVRPPGHHASPNSHWGFCFFNNVAIAVERLLTQGKISSALILDIDLHFGDGTDNIFAGKPQVVVANIQENHRINFLEEVDKALSRNEYDIIAVSAGFDRHVQDWGGTLTTEDYFTIGKNVRDYSEQCSGRHFAALEGGYNIEVIGKNALALCRGMAGQRLS
jgi:acetoin utilization deacetylase AcuC-like enzyme